MNQIIQSEIDEISHLELTDSIAIIINKTREPISNEGCLSALQSNHLKQYLFELDFCCNTKEIADLECAEA